MKRYFLLIILITFITCNQEPDRKIINQKIVAQLKLNKDVKNIFLDLKFGMSKDYFNKTLDSLYLKNKIEKYANIYVYKFKNNPILEDAIWTIYSSLHNDSIISLNINFLKFLNTSNNYSINSIYEAVLKEFILKYGEPHYTFGNSYNYWFKNNLEILIKNNISNKTITINYIDIRKQISIDLTNCRFDDKGNSYDLWYYDKYKKPKINRDI